jgi:hypothetical protein
MALIALLAAAAFALQPVGSFHGDEPVARHGERWLALRVTPSAAALVDTRARVTPVHDVVVDADGARTGREVATTVPDAGLLVRGSGLRAGPVAVAALPTSPTLLAEAPLALRLGRAAYRITLDCRNRATRCDVMLAEGRRQQVLFALDAGYHIAQFCLYGLILGAWH